MAVPRMMQKVMGMSDAVWARHANPWSGWTRVTTLPLLALALWSRVWIGGWAALPVAAVLLWVWVNPRLFPEPKSTANWMSRGVLGEQLWLADPAAIAAHHRRVIGVLVALSAIGSAIYLLGLLLLNLTLTLVGMSVAMLAKLWLVDRMVWLWSDHTGGIAEEPSDSPA